MLLQNLPDDDEEAIAWEESFKTQLEGESDPVDEMYADFQFTLPEGI